MSDCTWGSHQVQALLAVLGGDLDTVRAEFDLVLTTSWLPCAAAAVTWSSSWVGFWQSGVIDEPITGRPEEMTAHS